ncbi:hypothetical protein GCM10009007_07820 [Formosimonas limnophila]|uniref:ATPase AAA-type core domain-containing protein n=1 Tax=Formosimonas limnophila TaxID=1384487 RepID=A0A8J3FYY7_9BURK|nr:ATP-binding protein [Formosimonas limnophila]GHA69406.1 hypothetical protein GCM10009007_07820 [Formosimonas limnophila]
MIIDFTLSNYGPFKEPVVLTFEASNDTHLAPSYVREFTFENGKSIKLLRMALLYGANAAGKTTILEALSLLDRLVTKPVRDTEDDLDVNSFAFTKNPEPTSIIIKFIRLGVVYRYQLDVTSQGILCETLEYQSTPPNGVKFALIYQRCRGDVHTPFVIKPGPGFKLNKAETEKLQTELLPNTTMLSVLNRNMTIQNDKVQQAYLWFKEQLLGEVTPRTDLTHWVTKQLEDKRFNQPMLLSMMNQAGIPIQDLNFTERGLDAFDQRFLKETSDEGAKEKYLKFLKDRPKEVHTVYQVGDDNYELNLEKQESLGTQRYYGLSGLFSALCTNHDHDQGEPNDACRILPIDEIEHSLHPSLLEHFIVTFLNDSSNSQLIATTHYREFLQDKLLFRDDVIWFVDKDAQTMASDLYCLEDIKTDAGLRETSSVYNFYKHGRLGGVPKLGD